MLDQVSSSGKVKAKAALKHSLNIESEIAWLNISLKIILGQEPRL